MIDEELVERVATAMWDWCHDGSWEDVEFCVSQTTRDIYLTDARIAIEIVNSTRPHAAGERNTP